MNLFESIMLLQGYNIRKAENILNVILSYNNEQLKAWQEKSKWSIARFHYQNNDMYRKKVGNYFPDKWEDLPIMEKLDYQDDLEKLLTKGYTRKNTYISNTSGSSGHPFFFAKSKDDHSMDWAYIKYNHGLLGINHKWRQARIYGIPIDKRINNIKERIKDKILNRFRFPVHDLSSKKLKHFLFKFQKTRFDYIYGYTNSLVLFAKYILEKQFTLKEICPTLKCCICTSEVLTIDDRNILEIGFGIPIFNEYGASETKLIAFESCKGEMILGEEVSFIEIVKKNGELKDRESGNIIITDYFNKAMPFIRYNIGDIGIISKELSENGKNRKLEKLLGRENDTIILPSGKISPGLTFYYISRSILESSGVLKEFIIRQIKLDTFVFDIVTDRDLYESEIDDIKNKMETYLESGLNLVINRVPAIKRPKSGKLKQFYSEIP